MKHSIRVRFTLMFVGLTMLILIGIWGVNNLFLERFYVNQKVDALRLAYSQIDQLVVKKMEEGGSIRDEFPSSNFFDSGEQTEGVQLLRRLGDENNIMTIIVDGINDYPIVSSGRDARFMMDRIRRYIVGDDQVGNETILETDQYTIQRSFDKRSSAYYLECWGFFSDNSTIFIMSTPLASIRESVELSNQFLAYVGIAAMILSCLIIYVATKRVTSPILKLAGISERMSNLDFEAKYEGSAQDEIGVLGNSMNTLSNRLKETIGELKEANIELQKDIQEKIQIDDMRKEFIANVSHELKTPIALIQGYAEGLAEGMAEDKESRDYYCEVIVDEAGKMNKMVRQLLTLTALEFGNDQVSLERFDLIEVIKGVLSSASILIQQKHANIQFPVYGPVYVWADEFKIEEVITNYLNNALNHLGGKGIIHIMVEELGNTVRVTVRNTGEHIPEEELPNIWTKFYKVDKARTREYGGSGIGLSIVKAIMDSHHREYGARNVEDGVEFWFTLDAGDDGEMPREK